MTDLEQCDVVLIERWACLSANELLFWILFLVALPLLLQIVGAVLFGCRSWGEFFILIKKRFGESTHKEATKQTKAQRKEIGGSMKHDD